MAAMETAARAWLVSMLLVSVSGCGNITMSVSNPFNASSLIAPVEMLSLPTNTDILAAVSCSDDCASSFTKTLDSSSYIASHQYSPSGGGNITYGVHQYTVKCQRDSGSGAANVTISVHLRDWVLPTVHILGSKDLTIEASQDGEYNDQGAFCRDNINNLNYDLEETKGDIVQRNVPITTTYTIEYTCVDRHKFGGNRYNGSTLIGSRVHATRKVTVVDTVRPTINVSTPLMFHEYATPFNDATTGVTYADDMTPNVNMTLDVSGDTVNAAMKHISQTSCHNLDPLRDGNYFIKPKGHARLMVYCFGDVTLYQKTVTTTAVKPFTTDTQSECGSVGLVSLTQTIANGYNLTSIRPLAEDPNRRIFSSHTFCNAEGTNPFTDLCTTSTFLCTTPDSFANLPKATPQPYKSPFSGAPGIFVILYNVEDLSGNKADTARRTVIVEDTTGPNITLSLCGQWEYLNQKWICRNNSLGLPLIKGAPMPNHAEAYPHVTIPYDYDASAVAEVSENGHNWWLYGSVVCPVGIALLSLANRPRAPLIDV